MIMWIILGSLIGIVAIFLIVTGVMDKKRSKKLKIQKQLEENLRKDSTDLIALWIMIVVEENQRLLNEFIPSIGLIKMQNIKQTAKSALQLLTKEQAYKLIQKSNNYDETKKFFNELLENSSNNWERNHFEAINFFQQIAQKVQDVDKYKSFKDQAKQKIQTLYYDLKK